MLKIPSPPIARFLKVIAVLVTFTVALQASAPQGWVLAGSKPMDYETGTDRTAIYNHHPSAFLRGKKPVGEGFGTLMQEVAAGKYAGKRVRLSAFSKADDIENWAGVWMRVDKESTVLAFDNMQDRPLKGSIGWHNREVVLDVPQDATGIAFGVLLTGSGTVWLNSVKLEVVGPEVPVTSNSYPHRAEPANLSFDQ
jgi:hypothetical protein